MNIIIFNVCEHVVVHVLVDKVLLFVIAGIDMDTARNEEENRMLEDANQWLNSGVMKEKKHPKTGATALHVAAAKGYIKVMK